jgi:hypothetical protein
LAVYTSGFSLTLLRAKEFGVDPFSSVYPEVYGDVIWMRVRAYEAQVDLFCACLVEDESAGHVVR